MGLSTGKVWHGLRCAVARYVCKIVSSTARRLVRFQLWEINTTLEEVEGGGRRYVGGGGVNSSVQ